MDDGHEHDFPAGTMYERCLRCGKVRAYLGYLAFLGDAGCLPEAAVQPGPDEVFERAIREPPGAFDLIDHKYRNVGEKP